MKSPFILCMTWQKSRSHVSIGLLCNKLVEEVHLKAVARLLVIINLGQFQIQLLLICLDYIFKNAVLSPDGFVFSEILVYRLT